MERLSGSFGLEQEVRRDTETKSLLISWPPERVSMNKRSGGQEAYPKKQHLLISWPPVNVASL
jgi:hypothetical protein